MPFKVDLVSPEGSLFSGEASMVVARSVDGDIAFQPGHVPFIGVLATNRVKLYLTDDTETVMAVHRGFVEVSGESVTVLSDVAELAADIDVPRAEAALARATDALRIDGDNAEAAAASQRASIRIEVAATA
jgi:F-type H+-transporting ATPase subunit epsilon